jgi:excisionase family DNA binding protein
VTDPLPADLADAVERLAQLIAERVFEHQHRLESGSDLESERSPWMSIDTAARHLDWPRQRLYKLTGRGRIPHYKHEGRLLFHRGELDAWLQRFAAGDRD